MNFKEFDEKLDALIIFSMKDNTSLKDIEISLELSLISIKILCDKFGENQS